MKKVKTVDENDKSSPIGDAPNKVIEGKIVDAGNSAAKDDDIIYSNIRLILINSHNNIVRTINSEMVNAYWHIGKYIFEAQGRKERADYGTRLIKYLSEKLTKEFGKGFSERGLRNMRQFYELFQIRQTVSAKSNQLVIDNDFKLSWSHYTVLIKIEDENERKFYEIEAISNNWSIRELERQYHSSLYERLALSKDKNKVMELSKKGQIIEHSKDIIKSPVVLEFLGLKEDASYSENNLESAIISKLQNFLLELGKGFLFEARQKRFSFDNDNYYVDLVFYNRLLSCYVLIDLKIGKITHQDLGQMLMYVNYYDRYVKKDTEKPTVGILLCGEKNDSLVKITLPKNSHIYASEYKLHLPDKKLLQNKLKEWVKEFESRKDNSKIR
jgi:predicted nuclease of restriction endonuclease-like (RecB) superfamily